MAYQDGAFRRTALRVTGDRVEFEPSGPYSVGERRITVGDRQFVDRGERVVID